jgi:hypothetical protein
MRPASRALLLAAAILLAAQPGDARADDKMTFRNNLLPGHLSAHNILRVTRRTVQRKDHVEKLSYAQVARWVQCNLAESKPGHATTYQMMVDQRARVVSLFHGAKSIKPLPSAASFNLSKSSTRLHSVTRSPRDNPYQVPLCDEAQRAVLRAMLDVAHWPREKAEAGRKWERDIRDGGFEGTQRFEFLDLVRIKGNVVARVKMKVEGAFSGSLEKSHDFIGAEAVIYWARLDRVLLKMEGRAAYTRRRPADDEQYELELNVDLENIDMLNEGQRDGMLDQLNVFAKAYKNQLEDEKSAARSLCRRFRDKWPDSIWMPAIDELEDRVSPKKTGPKRLKTSQIKKLLGKGLIAWEAARVNGEYDTMDKTRDGLEQLVKDYRPKVLALAESDKSKTRAQAVFALAFSERSDDFSFVQRATRDNSSRVRGMALAGLAARQDPKTSADMLIILLSDKKPAVRSRACQAVAACINREHLAVAKLVDELNTLMLDDENHAVRQEAVQAIAAIGAPADIQKLEKALTHELNQPTRRAIEKAIKRLEKLKE